MNIRDLKNFYINKCLTQIVNHYKLFYKESNTPITELDDKVIFSLFLKLDGCLEYIPFTSEDDFQINVSNYNLFKDVIETVEKELKCNNNNEVLTNYEIDYSIDYSDWLKKINNLEEILSIKIDNVISYEKELFILLNHENIIQISSYVQQLLSYNVTNIDDYISYKHLKDCLLHISQNFLELDSIGNFVDYKIVK
ncbi:MAG: hypothetical protein R3Y13_05305 [bacterium]